MIAIMSPYFRQWQIINRQLGIMDSEKYMYLVDA